MNLPMCARCKKRPAAVFITRNEGGKTINEGLCFVCAHEIGVKPLDNMLRQMGMSDETIESMSGELEEAMADVAELSENQDDGGAPAIDFNKFLSGMGFPPMPDKQNGASAGKQSSKKSAPKEDGRKFLNTYCTCLTKKATDGKIDRIIGRDRELDRVIQILSRRQKNNPCLIGEPGVGKTAIAEALAQRIVDKTVPERLADCEVWLLDLTALVAGTQFRGQFEQRILGLIKEVKSAGKYNSRY